MRRCRTVADRFNHFLFVYGANKRSVQSHRKRLQHNPILAKFLLKDTDIRIGQLTDGCDIDLDQLRRRPWTNINQLTNRQRPDKLPVIIF